MTRIAAAYDRLEQAHGLAALMDATHDAFENMLTVIRANEDPDDGMFIPLVMAAASAADGRNAIAFAPSLPPHQLHPPPAGEKSPQPGSVQEIKGSLAALSALLATRLADAATSALDPEDRSACTDAACSARDIHAVLTGTGP